MPTDDPIERSLQDIDVRGGGGTMQSARREFQREGITRPDDRPQAGPTLLERGKAALFGTRKSDRDQRQERR